MREKFMRNAGTLAVLIAGLSTAGCGSSSPGLRDGLDGAFIRAAATWDLNHDGNVTCDEWKQYAASVFKDADTNRDGKLTREEFDKLGKIDRLFLIADFTYYDEDKKGFVSLADLTNKPNPAFQQLDTEHTCVIKTYQLRAAISGDIPGSDPGSPTAPKPSSSGPSRR
jgi:Ca2+-binding EF-hand superfamily protein